MQASRTRKNKTPDPWAPAVLDLNVDTQEASRVRDDDDDDLYDATPRTHSTALQSARTGDSQGSLDSRNILAPRHNTNGSASGGADSGREGSTRAELEDTEEKRKISMRREAQEEKILYDPNEEDGPSALSGNIKTGDMDGNDPRKGAPHMSATSYPGMEWNPYASRPYEDWNE